MGKEVMSLTILFCMLFIVATPTVVNAMPVVNPETGENHLTLQSKKYRRYEEWKGKTAFHVYLSASDTKDLISNMEDFVQNTGVFGWGAQGLAMTLKKIKNLCHWAGWLAMGASLAVEPMKKRIEAAKGPYGVMFVTEYATTKGDDGSTVQAYPKKFYVTGRDDIF